jgi:hypothetical protein
VEGGLVQDSPSTLHSFTRRSNEPPHERDSEDAEGGKVESEVAMISVTYKIFQHRQNQPVTVYDIVISSTYRIIHKPDPEYAVCLAVESVKRTYGDVFEVHWTEGEVKGTALLRFIQTVVMDDDERYIASTFVPIQG